MYNQCWSSTHWQYHRKNKKSTQLGVLGFRMSMRLLISPTCWYYFSCGSQPLCNSWRLKISVRLCPRTLTERLLQKLHNPWNRMGHILKINTWENALAYQLGELSSVLVYTTQDTFDRIPATLWIMMSAPLGSHVKALCTYLGAVGWPPLPVPAAPTARS